MSTATTTERRAHTGPASRLSARRLKALGRAEMTLLLRNRSALFVALAVPICLTVAVRPAAEQADLAAAGLSMGAMLLPGSVGMVLLFAIYSNLVGVYVMRREELVLKRLRTGEANDLEILLAAALPSIVIGIAQSVLLLAGGGLLLDLGAPRPHLLLLGIALGMAMMAALAAASAAVTKTAEMAQLTPMPLMMVSFGGSGLFLPLEAMPDSVADICRFLPLTPVIDLLRGAWTHTLSGPETLRAMAVAVAWIALGCAVVRRRFPWEPRR